MPKRPSKGVNGSESKTDSVPSPIVSKYQQFTTETVHRSVLKNAPYNPRHITERGKAKLKDVLQRVGLVQTLVWNKRTGNLVGGHQRIKALDSLEGNANYSLTVAVVDVDDMREKELNVLLNNADVGGEWELEKLKTMLTDSDLELLNTGFDNSEIMKIFGEAPARGETDHGAELSKKLQDMKDTFTKLEKANAAKDDRDFYNVVVFGTSEDRTEFLKEFGFEDNRYLDGRTLVGILRELKLRADAVGNLKGGGKKT